VKPWHACRAVSHEAAEKSWYFHNSTFSEAVKISVNHFLPLVTNNQSGDYATLTIMEKEMTFVEQQDGLAVLELSREDIEFVSAGDGTNPPPPPPACECHTDRNNNLVCQDANGRTCG
jgi:hypothetical protein